MALVLSPFPLNVDKIENNGIANSPMWQMGNWDRETLNISLKALLHLGSCPLSIILDGGEAQESCWSDHKGQFGLGVIWMIRFQLSQQSGPAQWAASLCGYPGTNVGAQM